MKTILTLLAVAISLTGCGTYKSMDDLMVEASQCIIEYNENGILKPAPEEYKRECWEKVNRREESDARREKERRAGAECRRYRMIKYCDNRGCGCITQEQYRRVIGSRRF